MDPFVARANELAAQGLNPSEIAKEMGLPSVQALRTAMSRRKRYYTVLAAQWLPRDEDAKEDLS